MNLDDTLRAWAAHEVALPETAAEEVFQQIVETPWAVSPTRLSAAQVSQQIVGTPWAGSPGRPAADPVPPQVVGMPWSVSPRRHTTGLNTRWWTRFSGQLAATVVASTRPPMSGLRRTAVAGQPS
ncbi:hypothetical protein JIG36_34020 [Actinoplanes sp. LDG1-06]|uniref:Uncharacterized protein n=1 Tax=Paractinoplanes ovalisporus TaxID=2810368 RepID=A0ABS2AL40_9ACTN|nr:hypothetical protein [Actinoplanes ovalisporus]MBM2620530.1 hypothetical protein [Actinoplanes ovalisporus]